MVNIGYWSLIAAFAISAYSAVAAVVGAKRNSRKFILSAEISLYTVLGLISTAAVCLLYALVTDNFRLEYVASHSSRNLSLIYKLSAFWAGNDGSLLFGGWLLALFSALVLIQNRHENRALMPYVTSTLMVISLFFLAILVFVSNPFRKLPEAPADGLGLNPLLQNLWMIFHSLPLFIGYVGFSVPFAFAIAALITGKLEPSWIKSTRRWMLFSWFSLTVGIILGARWSYIELGRGSYWSWDLIENASLMLWLVGAAYIHSVMIQERRGMFKVWNMVLIFLTFLLCIFGMFLTCSGIAPSVYTLGKSPIGYCFIGFIVIALEFSVILLLIRLNNLKSENRLYSLISREYSFFIINIIFMGLAFIIFLRTALPILSEIALENKISVILPFVNQVSIPISLLLLLLTGICSLIAWRKTSLSNLLRHALYPIIIALCGGIVLFLILIIFPWIRASSSEQLQLSIKRIYVVAFFTLALFALSAILSKFIRGLKNRSQSQNGYFKSLMTLIRRNRRRYGGYSIHIGVVVIFVAITGSAFNAEHQLPLKKGESADIGDYTVRYDGWSKYSKPNKEVYVATLSVLRNGKQIGVLKPEKDYYKHENQITTEIALRSTLKEDLYAILVGYGDDADVAVFKFFVNPLVVWMWIGGVIMGLGSIAVMWPEKK